MATESFYLAHSQAQEMRQPVLLYYCVHLHRRREFSSVSFAAIQPSGLKAFVFPGKEVIDKNIARVTRDI